MLRYWSKYINNKGGRMSATYQLRLKPRDFSMLCFSMDRSISTIRSMANILTQSQYKIYLNSLIDDINTEMSKLEVSKKNLDIICEMLNADESKMQ